MRAGDVHLHQGFTKKQFSMQRINSLMDWIGLYLFNLLRLRQNGCHLADDISNACFWMKMLEFQSKVHWSLFLRFQLIIFQHWFRLWLGADEATSLYLNQWYWVYWRIYASLGLNELTMTCPSGHISHHIYGKWYIWIWFHICKLQTQLGDWYFEYPSKHYIPWNECQSTL